MTPAELTGRSRVGAPRPFFLIMALVLGAIVLLGFSHTVPSDLAAPGFPPFLVAHGVVFFAWTALFVSQPALIGAGAVRLHRRLGWVGAGLAILMLVLATGAILFALWSDQLPPFYPPGLFLFRGLISVAVFAGLVVAGIAHRRRPEWHKRLMLCATIVVVVPGLERALPVPDMGRNWPYMVDGVVLLLALAGPVVDLATRRRIHPAYIWGVGAILSGQVAVDALTLSPMAPVLVRIVRGH